MYVFGSQSLHFVTPYARATTMYSTVDTFHEILTGGADSAAHTYTRVQHYGARQTRGERSPVPRPVWVGMVHNQLLPHTDGTVVTDGVRLRQWECRSWYIHREPNINSCF